MTTKAIIFLPGTDQLAEHATTCMDYCAARGYHVAGVVTADWVTAMLTVTQNEAVLVVARPDHLDPQRLPRVEIATDPDRMVGVTFAPLPTPTSRRRRPRTVA